MSRRDDSVRLQHMLSHAREAVTMVEGRSRGDLDTDRQLNLSLVRLVEIIGEAAARVTLECRDSLPSLPWVEIIGFRNRLIHGYDEVDFDILWATVVDDLPAMITLLEASLPPEA